MKYFLFTLAFILLTSFKGAEESSIQSFDKLNTIEMIVEDESFIINTTESSIAFFDSFDRNSIAYITNDKSKFLSKKDERITGKFIEIEPYEIYYVRIHLISEKYASNIRKYLYPFNIFQKSISIKGADLNFLKR